MATAASVDTSASIRSEREMHGELASAASRSAAWWEQQANIARGHYRRCMLALNRDRQNQAEAWRREAIRRSRVATSRAALAAHHREKAAK